MTWNPHLKGEEVFGLAKHDVDYSPRANDDSHKLNHVNLFCPRVAIPPSQLNNVDNLHIHWPPCNSHKTLPTISQGGYIRGGRDYMGGWHVAYWSMPT